MLITVTFPYIKRELRVYTSRPFSVSGLKFAPIYQRILFHSVTKINNQTKQQTLEPKIENKNCSCMFSFSSSSESVYMQEHRPS